MNAVINAKPGFVGIDGNGNTWTLTADDDERDWLTSEAVDGRHWHTHDEARKANLTPTAPTDMIDADDPAQLRNAVELLEDVQSDMDAGDPMFEAVSVVREWLEMRADRLDTDKADRETAMRLWERYDASVMTFEQCIRAAIAAGRTT